METLPAVEQSKSPDEIRREFAEKKHRNTLLILTAPLTVPLVGAPFYFLSGLFEGDLAKVVQYAGIALWVLAVTAFNLTNWTCPACEKHFGKGFFGSICPHCHAELT